MDNNLYNACIMLLRNTTHSKHGEDPTLKKLITFFTSLFEIIVDELQLNINGSNHGQFNFNVLGKLFKLLTWRNFPNFSDEYQNAYLKKKFVESQMVQNIPKQLIHYLFRFHQSSVVPVEEN